MLRQNTLHYGMDPDPHGGPDSGAPGRQAVVVLGMHRSGTSALARIVSLLGADLPATLMPADASNVAGHWESGPVCGVNEALLASAGSRWDDWQGLNPAWYGSAREAQFAAQASAVLAAEYGASGLFVLKDPRICRLYPFWRAVLGRAGVAALPILVVRNPVEVGLSLARRNGFEPDYGHLLWLRHVLDAESATRGAPRAFWNHDAMLHGWAGMAARAGVDLGLGWPRLSASTAEEIGAFLAADLRHHQVPAGQVLDNPLICGWVREAYAILLRWAAGEEAAADYARLDAIRVAFDEAGEGFAGLVARGQAGLLRAGALAGELAADRALHARAAEEEARARTALAAELAADLAADLARAQAEAQAREGAIALRLAAAEVALAERGRDAEVLAGQLAEAESALRDSRAEAAAAASALAGQAAQLNTARRALAAAEAREQQRFGTLLRAKEELAGALRGLARARAAAAEVAPLQAALAEARGQAAQQAQALEAALAGQAALASARDAAQQALAQQQAQAVVQAAQQAQAAQAAEAAQAALLADATRAAEEAAQAARARLAELEENLAARFHEMAAMARLLQQAEAAAAARAEEANWLRGLGAVLTCRAGWEGWLPPPLRLRRQHQRLAGAGLFDAAAYLAAHPDVRAAGAEPLRHLLQHGLAEGRCVPGRHEGGAA